MKNAEINNNELMLETEINGVNFIIWSECQVERAPYIFSGTKEWNKRWTYGCFGNWIAHHSDKHLKIQSSNTFPTIESMA